MKSKTCIVYKTRWDEETGMATCDVDFEITPIENDSRPQLNPELNPVSKCRV